jgi:hypothetical protein
VPRARPSCVVLLALACAGAPAPLPPGASAAPARGDALDLLLAKLAHAEESGPAIEIEELRLIAVDAQPWRTLEREAARREPGLVAVVAGRRCTRFEGWRRRAVERPSWFVFSAGALGAFDHQGFDAACGPRPAFEPAGAEQVALERSLQRYVSQRWELEEIRGGERLARGLRLLERGRPEDALAELRALDRHLAELARRQGEAGTLDADEREALRAEEERLLPQRAELARALRETAALDPGGLR